MAISGSKPLSHSPKAWVERLKLKIIIGELFEKNDLQEEWWEHFVTPFINAENEVIAYGLARIITDQKLISCKLRKIWNDKIPTEISYRSTRRKVRDQIKPSLQKVSGC